MSMTYDSAEDTSINMHPEYQCSKDKQRRKHITTKYIFDLPMDAFRDTPNSRPPRDAKIAPAPCASERV